MARRLHFVAGLGAIWLAAASGACATFSDADANDGVDAAGGGSDAPSGSTSTSGTGPDVDATPPPSATPDSGAPPPLDATSGDDSGGTVTTDGGTVTTDGGTVTTDGGTVTSDGGGADAGGDAASDGGPTDAGSDANAGDAGADASAGDSGADAGPRCTASKGFGSPEFVDDLNTTGDETSISFTSDELQVFITRQGAGSATDDVYWGTRASRDVAFGALTKLTPPSTSAKDEQYPSVTATGNVLFFAGLESSPDAADTANDVFFATVSNGVVSTPVQFAGIDTLGASETMPFIGRDNAHLYFGRSQTGVMNRRILVATLGTSFSVMNTAALDLDSVPGSVDGNPVVGHDGKIIYFTSNRPLTDGGAVSDYNIFAATATTSWTAFGAPAVVTTLDSASNDAPGWLSDDGCLLYILTRRAPPGDVNNGGLGDIWVARRSK